MDLLNDLILGFQVALSPENLFFCFVGALIGTLVGVLPGIGPIATMSMLLPATFYLPPTGALIMLAGIYYGAQYGGSTTAILVNLPGEASAVVTCIDGYAMAQKGRAGSALAIAAVASFFAGTVCVLLIAVIAPQLATLALSFRAAEYFSLMVLGLTGAVVLASGSATKAVGMVLVGLGLGLIGTDTNSSYERFTFGLVGLADGIGFVPLALGMLGIAEIIWNLEKVSATASVQTRIGTLWPTFDEFRKAWPAVIRGTGVGAVLGILPGGGAILSSFASYTLEKKLSRDPSQFGNGAVEGVAGPEAANNAGAQTSFIPMLTLGIPSSAVMALMIGAMMMQGIVPGPGVMTNQPTLFWGVIASMWIGNAMLLIINLPLIGIWLKLLNVPYRILYPCIVIVCAIGAFSIANSPLDVFLVGIFGAFGYLVRKLGCEAAPLALGFVLGPLMEENLRRALILSRGDLLTFVERPISAALLILSLLLTFLIVFPKFRATRKVAFGED